MFQNKLGDTPLHAAAWKGYSDIVEMLLNKSKYLSTSCVWFYKEKFFLFVWMDVKTGQGNTVRKLQRKI